MRRARILSCLLWTSAVAGCSDPESFTDAAPEGPEAQFSAGTIAFGTADCGTTPEPETLEVTNVGTAPVTWSAEIEGAGFTLDGPTEGTVAVGAMASLTVVPDPIAVTAIADEDLEATLRVTTNTSAGTVEIDLQITPRGGSLELLPATVDLGTTPVGVSATDVDVMISNTGNAPLDVTIVDAPGDEFTITYPDGPGAVTLAAGGNFTITTDFAPVDTAGTRNLAAAITIDGVRCAGATEVPLTGISSTGTLSFGAFPTMAADCGVATPGTQSLTITNTSTTSPVTISGAGATGGFTVLTTLPLTIAPSGTGSLVVRPPASVVGTDLGGSSKTGTLSFTTNETGNPTHDTALTSTVMGANIVFTDTADTTPITSISLDAADACPAPRSVAIRNTGNVGITGFQRSGSDNNFAFQQTPSSAIAGGAFTTLTVGAYTTNSCSGTDNFEYTWATANVCTTTPAVLGASFSVSGQSFCFCS